MRCFILCFFMLFHMILLNKSVAQCNWGNTIQPLGYMDYYFACIDADSDWKLYFEDNFDGSSLNELDWTYPFQGVVAGYDFNGSKTWYANTGTTPSRPISDNIVVENGSLKIIARKESSPITGTVVTAWNSNGTPTNYLTSSFDYSSGWIESKKKFSYGYFEIRCKIPKGRGFWPSFWLFDERNSIQSEIDVFEFWNESTCLGSFNPSKLSRNPHFTVHGNYTNPGEDASQCGADLYPCASNGGVDFSLIPHTFAINWTPLYIEWYIDNVLVHTLHRFYSFNLQNGQSTPVICSNATVYDNYYANQAWPITDRMQVRFNLALQHGSSNPDNTAVGYNNAPDASTPFPSAFEIEYFRYYRHAEVCSQNVNFDYNNGFTLDPEMFNRLSGQNITIWDHTIASSTQLYASAVNSVVLDPGFEAVNGSTFIANIAPEYCVIHSGMTLNNNIDSQETIYDKYQIQENTLETENLTDIDLLKVYPNPANDLLMIELTSSSGELNLVEITDNQGRSLLRVTRELNDVMNLDISDFSTGTYLVKILNKSSGKVYLERFTKN